MSSRSYPINLKDIGFSYAQKRVFENFDLSIEPRQIYSLVGESGCGKTTLLKVMNGLLQPQSGRVDIDGIPFDYSKAEKVRRGVGYSIQGSGLFPHMSISENMTIIARKEGWDRNKIEHRIQELCELVNLPSNSTFLYKKPREISGGQQQRVGIARALFLSPKVLLMDEPFGALDPITREEIQDEFIDLQHRLKLTIVIVTHDLAEAFKMSDQIVLLNQGKIEQIGKPRQFILKPASDYVVKFMESHSPGKILKNIKLYAVVNSDILVSQKNELGYSARNCETSERFNFADIDSLLQKHKQLGQRTVVWETKEEKLERFQRILKKWYR